MNTHHTMAYLLRDAVEGKPGGLGALSDMLKDALTDKEAQMVLDALAPKHAYLVTQEGIDGDEWSGPYIAPPLSKDAIAQDAADMIAAVTREDHEGDFTGEPALWPIRRNFAVWERDRLGGRVVQEYFVLVWQDRHDLRIRL